MFVFRISRIYAFLLEIQQHNNACQSDSSIHNYTMILYSMQKLLHIRLWHLQLLVMVFPFLLSSAISVEEEAACSKDNLRFSHPLTVASFKSLNSLLHLKCRRETVTPFSDVCLAILVLFSAEISTYGYLLQIQPFLRLP